MFVLGPRVQGSGARLLYQESTLLQYRNFSGRNTWNTCAARAQKAAYASPDQASSNRLVLQVRAHWKHTINISGLPRQSLIAMSYQSRSISWHHHTNASASSLIFEHYQAFTQKSPQLPGRDAYSIKIGGTISVCFFVRQHQNGCVA